MNPRLESALFDATHLRREVALATYGKELLRRCEAFSSGPAVLALWRRFAWKPSGSPIPNFELEAAEILDAERRVIKAVLSRDRDHHDLRHGIRVRCAISGRRHPSPRMVEILSVIGRAPNQAWSRYRRRLPDGRELYQVWLPADLPVCGKIAGSFDYVPPDRVLAAVRTWMTNRQERELYYFLTETVGDEPASSPQTKTANLNDGLARNPSELP